MPLKMWDTWSVFMAHDPSENPAAVGEAGTEARPLLKVVIDLVLKEGPLTSAESFLVQWVGQREGQTRLCCNKLQIWSMAISYHRGVLERLDLDSIQELSLLCMNNPTCLLNFSPYLGRMRNLRSLLLSSLWSGVFLTPVEKDQIITQFTSQFVKLKHLQSLHLDNVFFLEGHLDQLFWMSFQTLPTLVQLALQSLLRVEALAISAVQDLPWVLFPPVFKEAFNHRQTNILRAMVAVWPFPCLPVGSLMKNPHLETLQAVLDGVDLLLTQVWPRSCKLKVVDFRAVNHNFWHVWGGAEDHACSPQVIRKQQKLEDLPKSEERQPLKIIVDICLKFCRLDECHTHLLQWAKPRKKSLQFCCPKLQMKVLPVCTIIEILKVFEPDTIQELELNSRWRLEALAHFAPYLGQMRNLQKFLMAGVYVDHCLRKTFTEMEYVHKFLSQFSKLNCLQHLYMNQVYSFSGHMDHLVRCLKNPLETLSITLSLVSQSDLNLLPQCQSLWQLKHLNLSGIPLFFFHFKPIQILLESITATLQTLEFEGCELNDSHITALLPGLSQCSQLTKINFYGNGISMLVLEDLVHRTAKLRQLTHELYPAPLECYDNGSLILDRFIQLCSSLMTTLRAIRQPEKVSFGAGFCSGCNERCVYSLEIKLCSCWQSD
ncbi:PRAME family member 12-like protein [Cricetulus griseus]|uniref:PRAME family member 12-like protein n=2 Tax=Cricetulus griseus TaxID=10029 RepID=A0A061IHB3_CRIGR|nr:PRAME family member 12-like protein [Cricetulus griseus]